MRRIVVAILSCFLLSFSAIAEDSAKDFRAKLSIMLSNIEKSIGVLREQISDSQGATFLPDLYLELGNLLSMKSNGLYYISMERAKIQGHDLSSTDKKLTPVVEAQKEAIAVFKQVLEEFPQYKKRAHVQYLLAVSYRAIDESIEFIKVTKNLLSEYPKSDEATRARLLLGQYLFDKMQVDEAIEQWLPVAKSSLSYERNLAKYRLGLAYTYKEKFKESLRYFEEVVRDDELANTEEQATVSLEKREVVNDLKREALLDSIKPFTNVFKKNPKPVEYYSNLAPTESHFQETIEKLAMRYVFLKKYNEAIGLLRTLSERTADPHKVISIYRDVLNMIPLRKRMEISADEIRFALERLNYWQWYLLPDSAMLKNANNFFEIQIRELGTRAHRGITGKNNKKEIFLDKAVEFYQLYLAYFHSSKEAAKVAANLGDVFLQQKDYLNCGKFYLRTALGEFGKPEDPNKVIGNALFCLDKKEETTFYRQLRKRGLLISTINKYFEHSPQARSNPRLNFVLARSVYEQGLTDEGLKRLSDYIRRFPTTNHAADAGEIILDHFNKRQDFVGLARATKILAASGIKNDKFLKRVASVQTQAHHKMLQERVKLYDDYDDFSQGKSYLRAAMSIDDDSLRSTAFQEALGKSRSEGDFETFAKTAAVMADNEADPAKFANLVYSLAKEHVNVGQYFNALRRFEEVLGKGEADEKVAQRAVEESTNIIVLLKDYENLDRLQRFKGWARLSGSSRDRVSQALGDLLESPVEIPANLSSILLEEVKRGNILASLFKAKNRLDGTVNGAVQEVLSSKCGGSKDLACKWYSFSALEREYSAYTDRLKNATPKPEAVEAFAPKFQELWGRYQDLQGTRDLHLELVAAIRCRWLFNSFATFLRKVAESNAELRSVLLPNIKDTLGISLKYANSCQDLARKSDQVTPASRLCATKADPPFDSLIYWNRTGVASVSRSDPTNKDIQVQQRKLFSDPKNKVALLELAALYYKGGSLYHASAAAGLGAGMGGGEESSFRAVLGCATMDLGLLAEARYHLSKASEYQGLKARCSAKLKKVGL